VLRAFKAVNPHTKLIWVTGKNPSVFLRGLSALTRNIFDEIHEKTGLASFSNRNGFRFNTEIESILCTETNLIDTLLLRRLGAETFISPAAKFSFSSKKPEPGYDQLPIYGKFLALMSLVSEKPLSPDLSIPIPKEYLNFSTKLFKKNRHYVGLSPGAGSNAKQWPLKFFVKIAKVLTSQNVTPTFFLGPMEEHLKEKLCKQIPAAIFPESQLEVGLPKSPLLTIALARNLDFSLVNDSGGGHLVAAGGKKTITLFNAKRGAKFKSPFCEQIALNATSYNATKVKSIPYRPVLEAVEKALGELLKNPLQQRV